MESCNISAEIVKAVAARFSCGIKVDSVELFHNVYVIGNLKRRNIRLTEALKLYVFAVVLAYRNIVAYDVRYNHHSLFDFCGECFLAALELFKLLCEMRNLLFCLFRFLAQTLCHKAAYFLAYLVP